MCSCGKKRERWQVTMATGTKIVKSSETEANAFAVRHKLVPSVAVKKLGK